MLASRPPYSAGHETTDHRSAASSRSQERWASKPAAVSSDARLPRGGTCAASHARASDRNWASPGVSVRSTARIWHTVRYRATMRR